MGDDLNKPERDDAADSPPYKIPSHEPLPLPPEVTYTRPTLGTGLSKSNSSSQSAGGGSKNPDEPAPVQLGMGIAATTSFAGAVWAGVYLGEQIDKHWNHTGNPWGQIVMTLAGLAAGFYNMFRLLSRRTGKK